MKLRTVSMCRRPAVAVVPEPACAASRAARLRPGAASLAARLLALAALLAGTPLVATPAFAADLLVPSATYPDFATAIAAAQPGDVVRIAGGVYTEPLDISGKTDLRVEAAGKARLTPLPKAPFAVRVAGSTGITLDRLRIDSEPDTATGFLVETSTSVLISRCEVRNGDTVDILGSTGVTIRDCDFRDTSTGVFADSGSSRLRFERNTIVVGPEHLDAALHVAADDSLVIGNAITGKATSFDDLPATAWGIDVAGDRNVIAGNRITRLEFDGICVTGSSNAVIGNLIRNCGVAGIRIGIGGALGVPASGNLVSGNRISGRFKLEGEVTGASGIFLDIDAADSVVNGNTISKSLYEGIYCLGTGAIITANTIKGAGSGSADGDEKGEPPDVHGLLLAGSLNRAALNLISNPEGHGILVQGSGQAVIGNVIKGGALAPILDTGLDTVLVGNQPEG